MQVQQQQQMGGVVTFAINDLLMGLCCSLSILSALEDSVPESMLQH
jgi:hypothetical protein